MSTSTMTQPTVTPETASSRTIRPDRSIREIIAAGRGQQTRSSTRSAWLMAFLTGQLLWASFTPVDYGPLGWIALVPLLLLVRSPIRAKWLYTMVYFGGFVHALATLQWMRLGDPSMYFAWVALAIYYAAYFPVFVALARVAVHRWNVPMTLAVPVLWTGLEFFRAHLLTGFSWYYLGHTQYRWTTLIQISDVVGAYGVSFVVALANACLAGMLPLGFLQRLKLYIPGADPLSLQQGEPVDLRTSRRQLLTLGVVMAVVAATLVYGTIRRSQAEFHEGPRVALIQGDFTSSLKHDASAAQDIFNKHYQLTGKAVYPTHPDLIVWPETMYRDPLMVTDPGMTDEQLKAVSPHVPVEAWKMSAVPKALADLAKQSGAAMFIGIDTFAAQPSGFRHFNSAAFVRPDVGLAGRYDKLHLVPFGEYLPLRDWMPFLGMVSPISPEFSVSPGHAAKSFEWGNWRFASVICFEDTVPHLVRGIVRSTQRTMEDGQVRKVDCLVNLTNDGWFHGSSELDQHLITASFRAVECRTPMVRAVNTGISAIIDGDGIVIEPELFLDGDGQGRTSMRDPKTGRWHKQLNAVVSSRVPLDNRRSLYVSGGDWFAGGCGVACLMLMLSRFLPIGRRAETHTAA